VPFPPDMLSEDEELVLDLRPHWWFVAPASAYLGLALLASAFVFTQDRNTFWRIVGFLVALGLIVAVVNFALRYAQWVTTNFVVTDERVISRSGVVAKRGVEIPLHRIDRASHHQSLFGRMIGTGDLTIESADQGGRQTFSDIRSPGVVQREIYRQKEADEQRRLVQLGQTLAAQAQPGAPQPPSVLEQIEQLDRLRRSGAITEDEFQAKKVELLRRL
jgi:uncharacterized membrane protein YdbT with pleckstrin-like domain